MIHHGDCREVLPTLDAGSVQCVVTSPPFWTAHGGPEIGGEASAADYGTAFDALLTSVHRVLRADGSAWVVLGDVRGLPWTLLHRAARTWTISRVSAWDVVVVALLHHAPRTLAAWPRVGPPYDLVVTDHAYAPLSRRFIRDCLTLSTQTGDLVLDPCCGTGTVGLVATQMRRAFLGVECEGATAALATARVHYGR